MPLVQQTTQMESESRLLPEMHDAHVLNRYKQFYFFATYGVAAEH